MTCLPTCCSPDNPARYEPITYAAYMEWFSHQYDHVRESGVVGDPVDPGVPDGSPPPGTDFARGTSGQLKPCRCLAPRGRPAASENYGGWE